MTLTFSMPGEYTFDDLYVVCQPMASVEEQTEELGKESLQNIKTETNCIRGDITTTSDKILVFSIPYSAGFTAYVDGEKTELVQANSMYMGLELKKRQAYDRTQILYTVYCARNDTDGAWPDPVCRDRNILPAPEKTKRKGKTGEMSRLSVVLPACNEEPMVEKTCRTLRELLGQAGIRYELVLVDDGSSDGTWAAIEKVSREDKNVTGVHFPEISGKKQQSWPALHRHAEMRWQ